MITAISGSTGFIGRSLIRKMRELDWTIRMMNRDSFALSDQDFLEQKTEGSDVIINLAGAPVSRKWTPEYKQEIMRSRVDTTRRITGSIMQANVQPSVFISASAVGIYDSENLHNESSTAFAGTFLADVCRSWEQEAMNAADVTRVVILRTGVVLGKNGGALEKMHRPFSIGLGGKLGNGKQHVSFIHINDLVDAILFIIENPGIRGIVNAVSPYPSTNAELTDKLAKVMQQPAFLSVPPFALKMMFGEGAQILLEGQKVLPEKLLQAGFRFRYPTLQNALVEIYR
jgi:uncharacterized protein (TIGR01777 family)